MPNDPRDFPPEFADHIMGPLRRFVRVEAAAGLLLLIATVIALLIANFPFAQPVAHVWEQSMGFHFGNFEFSRSVRHWINDALMTLFFFVVSLELKRELVSGTVRHAAFPLAGALGGMLVPAGIYVTMLLGKPEAHGWGTAISTDTAFMLGCLALLGNNIPVSLRLFLLSLAVFDDVGAIIIVAVSYGRPLSWPAITIAVVLILVVFSLARVGVRTVPVYLLAGIGLWLAIDAAGVHPSIAGVLLGLLTPAREWMSGARVHRILARVIAHPTATHLRNVDERHDLRSAQIAATEAISPVERIEFRLHPWSAFLVMPVFALANAGVALSWEKLIQPVSMAVAVALLVGKPLGVLTMCWLSERTGLGTRPTGLSWPLIAGGSVLTGIGFTMSIFIADLAFDGATLDAAKVGILAASLTSGALGLLFLFLLTLNKRPGHARA